MVVVTMTTVGYGDMIPMTAAGRVFGCLSAYVGYTMAALPAAVLVVKFAQLTAAGDGQK
ncbi:Potassium voltage-gated channel subfamily D member 3 [Amphibalanus amphitrite]|uniref:Potassium voltage-gated channel subfamily D member 3 n=1 Tax=Amphibalanus amphitrite TaxID=1232801 RepID=A0A6A4V4S1_AMPAM|nr:Potassium voltage-gated channel subfamily D member 3 [Amphibalanus amphitrite]